MRRVLVIGWLVLCLSGCAVPQPRAYVPYERTPTPICTTKAQCDAMWLTASEQISNLAEMKIRVMTDNYIETFDGTHRFRLLGIVTRRPIPDGTYAIDASLRCGWDCGDLADRGIALFNQMVTASGIGFEQPAASEKK